MTTVTSRDGTLIAYDVQGAGPAVVLVGGGLDDGSENAPLAAELAQSFTVLNYARRGRAGSGDTKPYMLAREVEDVGALIAQAGGSAHLFGASSGGALALEAAAAGLPVDRVAVYEVPYAVDEHAVANWRQYTSRLTSALASNRHDEALELFMNLAGASNEDIAAARQAPFWTAMRELAPTLAYDAACLGDGPPNAERLGRIRQPTLVMTGEAAFDSHTGGLPDDFFSRAADELASMLPQAQRFTLTGQGHVGAPDLLATALYRFFTA